MLEIRNLSFSMKDVPKYWHGRGRAVSIFFDGMSVFFPAGERFFIASVRAHLEHAGPELRREVAAFAGQEGIHSREHDGYNEHLAEMGYPVAEMEERVERLLRRATKRLPKRRRLAVTCALEHFTGMMAKFLLGEPKNLEGADETMAAIWRWHAAEESEHKSVPYDVFLAAGGTWFERVSTLFVTTAIFWAKVFEHQVRMMHADGCLYSAREWWSLFHFLFVDPGSMWGLFRAFVQYLRPGFHPSDIDDGELLEAWKRANESAVAAAA